MVNKNILKKNVVYLLISLWVNRDKIMEILFLILVVMFLGFVVLIVIEIIL